MKKHGKILFSLAALLSAVTLFTAGCELFGGGATQNSGSGTDNGNNDSNNNGSGNQQQEEEQEELSGENVLKYSAFKEGDKLVDFTVKTYHSGYKEDSFNTADARGKVLVINFWYVSCGPCVAELPLFNEVLEEYTAQGEEVVMLAVHSNNGEEPQSFIDGDAGSTGSPGKVKWSDWNIIFGQDIGEYGKEVYYRALGGLGAYPTTVIVNAEGVITRIYPGPIINEFKDDLKPEIEKALGRAE